MKLKYVDHRKMTMNLRSAGGRFVGLEQGKTYEVTDREAAALLKRRNGSKPCWERVGRTQQSSE